MFASEYGWTKTFILEEVYPDDAFHLDKRIAKRRINDVLMQLNVSMAPRAETRSRQEFIDSLTDQLNKLDPEAENNDLDVEGMKALREKLKEKSRAVKVN